MGVLLAFSTAELVRPITDHRLAFSMAESTRTDERMDGFSLGKSWGWSFSFLWFFALHLASSRWVIGRSGCIFYDRTGPDSRTNGQTDFLWQIRPGQTDERTDEQVFFRKEQRSEPLLPLVFCFALGYQEAPLVLCFALAFLWFFALRLGTKRLLWFCALRLPSSGFLLCA